MNLKRTFYGAAAVALCGIFTYGGSADAMAAKSAFGGPGLEDGSYIATVDVPSVNINVSHDSDEVLTQATQGQTFEILEDMGDGWLKIQVGDTYGFIPQDDNTSVSEREEMDASDSEGYVEPSTQVEVTTDQRQNLVNFALQFVGGKYKMGGNDPYTGIDCSGFTRYVMQHGAGVSITRTSTTQSKEGRQVSDVQMRPGDLIFYGNGSKVNHVAMYIGGGQVVHASTYKTGIKVSTWNYRTPIRIMNMLGD